MTGFVWTDFYTEFATSLLDYADDRASLIEKVKQIYTNAKMKLPTLEKGNNIVDIDPFTIIRNHSNQSPSLLDMITEYGV